MQLRKKVEFKTNLPVQIALAYDNGILKQDGRFGDYWIYTLADERVMFVPPIVHDQIEKLHISRGQAFTITKQERRVGNKRVIEWLVDDTVGTPADEPARAECAPRTVPRAPVPPADSGGGGSRGRPGAGDEAGRTRPGKGAPGSGGFAAGISGREQRRIAQPGRRENFERGKQRAQTQRSGENERRRIAVRSHRG
jgi:hypothetical protein